MKEMILLAPFVSGTELMRTLARYGHPTFGLRIMGETELAEFALMKCGKSVGREIVSTGRAQTMIYGMLNGENTSFSDAVNLLNTLTELRGHITQNEHETMRDRLTGGEFPEANAELFDVYERYMRALDDEGLTDAVGYLRYALENAEPIDAEIMMLEEYPASMLGRALADKLSSGKALNVTLAGLFGVGGMTGRECRIVRSYGSMNEARDILNEIVSGGLAYDKCTVACAETSALPLMFRELSEEFGIPVTFGCGLPISCTAPARLLSLIRAWLTDGKCGRDGLDSVIFADEFDTKKLTDALSCDRNMLHNAVDTAGDLRLSLDSEENAERISALKNVLDKESEKYSSLVLAEKLFAELEKGIAGIIGNYAVVRPSCKALDMAAVSAICSDLDACAGTEECLDMLPCIMGRRVCAELSREGCLLITGIGKAAASLRENLFIAGLTASAFPGAPRENYLICDKDLLRFGEDVKTSERIVTDRREMFHTLLDLARSAGCRVRLSYSGFDTAELKENNASSVLFEVLREQVGAGAKPEELQKHIESKGYFEAGFSAADLAAKAYSEGKELAADEAEAADVPEERNGGHVFGVSAFPMYFTCQKRFYYSSVLKLGTAEKDDPMRVIAANTLGDLFHNELMEPYAAKRIHDPEFNMSEKEIIDEAYKIWDRFVRSRPPLDSTEAERQKNRFANMAKNALGFEKDNTVVMAEGGLDYEHGRDYKISGRFDRLDSHQNSNALTVADFKTGRSDGYKDDDFASCVQVMLYAYLLENEGVTVDEESGEKKKYKIGMGEYRFVRDDPKKNTCVYNDEMKSKIAALLDEIAEKLKNDSFEFAEFKYTCDYCDYKDICGREAKKK